MNGFRIGHKPHPLHLNEWDMTQIKKLHFWCDGFCQDLRLFAKMWHPQIPCVVAQLRRFQRMQELSIHPSKLCRAHSISHLWTDELIVQNEDAKRELTLRGLSNNMTFCRDYSPRPLKAECYTILLNPLRNKGTRCHSQQLHNIKWIITYPSWFTYNVFILFLTNFPPLLKGWFTNK